jgi:hypothetical protein
MLVQRLPINHLILKIASARIACPVQDEKAASGCVGTIKKRHKRINAKPWIHRQRVTWKWRVMPNPASGIGGGRTADIAAFGIHDNKKASINGGAAKILQNQHASGALLFEKGSLRFDCGNMTNGLFKASHGKIINGANGCITCGTVLRIPENSWNHADMRVDSHAKRGGCAAVCLG